MEKRCFFTGHRGLGADFSREKAYNAIKVLCEKMGVDTFVCGGAVGFDIEMGELVLSGAKKLRLESALSVAVTGGLLNTLPYWQTAFENKINKEMGALRFVYEKDGLMRGVMALARGLDDEK